MLKVYFEDVFLDEFGLCVKVCEKHMQEIKSLIDGNLEVNKDKLPNICGVQGCLNTVENILNLETNTNSLKNI